MTLAPYAAHARASGSPRVVVLWVESLRASVARRIRGWLPEACVVPVSGAGAFRPGRYDWSWTAGRHAHVVAVEAVPWRLAAELARHASRVTLYQLGYGLDDSVELVEHDIAFVAGCIRRRIGRWPPWWSDELDERYGARQQQAEADAA